MKRILALITLALAGCASDKEYTMYLQAQHEANKLAITEQKPLVRFTAQPGQNITGLATFEVFAPA